MLYSLFVLLRVDVWRKIAMSEIAQCYGAFVKLKVSSLPLPSRT